MESYYLKHREEKLEYQKQRYSQLKDEISHYNAEYYIKHKSKILTNSKVNLIVKKIHKLHDKIDDLTNLTENILKNHHPDSKYYKVTRKYKTKKNFPTIDTVSIQFD